jgi:hypothetical protein
MTNLETHHKHIGYISLNAHNSTHYNHVFVSIKINCYGAYNGQLMPGKMVSPHAHLLQPPDTRCEYLIIFQYILAIYVPISNQFQLWEVTLPVT